MNVGAVPPTSNRPMTVVPFDVMHHGLPIDRQGVPSPMLAFPRCGRASSNAKSKAPSVDCGKLAQSACLGGSSPSTTSELGRGQRFSVAIGAEFPAPKIVKTVSATRAVEELQRATERCCTIHARRIPQLPQANIGIRTGSQKGPSSKYASYRDRPPHSRSRGKAGTEVGRMRRRAAPEMPDRYRWPVGGPPGKQSSYGRLYFARRGEKRKSRLDMHVL